MAQKIPTEPIATVTTAYREVTIGKTTYHVTSVFLGEKDLGATLEKLAVQKVLDEIATGTKAALRCG